MRITEIKLENFRQFRGEQSFRFAPSDVGSVALLFGANGSGKTTLLNAFTWALYGDLSDDVEQQNRLATDCVWSAAKFGETVPVSVEVVFDHAGAEYRSRRSADVRKTSDEQSPHVHDLQLFETTEDGDSTEILAAQQRIETILPQRLSRFFFFNGERIEKLVGLKAYAEVKQDIKTLLGLEVVERAKEHLPKVERKLSAELKKHGGEKAAKIQEDIDQVQDQMETIRSEVVELEGQLAELTEERAEVLQLLRKHDGAGPLQRQRDEAHARLARLRSDLERVSTDYRVLVASRGFLAFTSKVSARAADLAYALHEKGSLPAPLKRDFVETLLEQGRCICGTELADGTSAARHVQEWRAKAGLAEVEAAWQRLGGASAGIADARTTLHGQLLESAERMETLRGEISRTEELKSKLDADVARLPMEDVQRLENKNADLDKRIRSADQELGGKRRTLEGADAVLTRLRNDLKNAEVFDQLAIKARERLELVQEVTKALEEILAIRSHDMRVRLDRKVKEVFAGITLKDQYPELSPNFELELFQDIDGERQTGIKSTGENQILSLSFVAAVSELARELTAERRAAGEDVGEDGDYPIVMDAAFGALDEAYQAAVAKALARMAPQMIVLVSKSQGLGVVQQQLAPHLSNLGVIVANTRNQDQESEMIVLNGHERPYVMTRQEDNWAELQEVR